MSQQMYLPQTRNPLPTPVTLELEKKMHHKDGVQPVDVKPIDVKPTDNLFPALWGGVHHPHPRKNVVAFGRKPQSARGIRERTRGVKIGQMLCEESRPSDSGRGRNCLGSKTTRRPSDRFSQNSGCFVRTDVFNWSKRRNKWIFGAVPQIIQSQDIKSQEAAFCIMGFAGRKGSFCESQWEPEQNNLTKISKMWSLSMIHDSNMNMNQWTWREIITIVTMSLCHVSSCFLPLFKDPLAKTVISREEKIGTSSDPTSWRPSWGLYVEILVCKCFGVCFGGLPGDAKWEVQLHCPKLSHKQRGHYKRNVMGNKASASHYICHII